MVEVAPISSAMERPDHPGIWRSGWRHQACRGCRAWRLTTLEKWRMQFSEVPEWALLGEMLLVWAAAKMDQKHTHRRMDIATLWLNRPMGQFSEKLWTKRKKKYIGESRSPTQEQNKSKWSRSTFQFISKILSLNRWLSFPPFKLVYNTLGQQTEKNINRNQIFERKNIIWATIKRCG